MLVRLAEPMTIADLLEQLGDIAPERVRLQPMLGTATEQDVIDMEAREDRLCELVDGVLVEKVMGFYESRLGFVLAHLLEQYLNIHNLGIVAGAAGMVRLAEGLVRIPDVSFVSYAQLPNGQVPRQPIPALAPDLAVEVLSASNTVAEMNRKLQEYFQAGVRVVWYIDPPTRSIRVYSTPNEVVLLHEDDTLNGGTVLPGFTLPVRDLFARAERSADTAP